MREDWTAPAPIAEEPVQDASEWDAPPLSADVVAASPVLEKSGGEERQLAAGAPLAVQKAGLVDPMATASGDDAGIAGLSQWLKELSLQRYEAKALEWCHAMGAVSLEEVEDSWEEFANDLALKPLERKRLAKKVVGR